ncbi:MAG: tRNA (adenosine(37)-N6)-threonylcarbamoyltransferase complex dimerization subunit type 1 TsaB, partial [Cyanobacteria bacterium P01_A01_bin.17]
MPSSSASSSTQYVLGIDTTGPTLRLGLSNFADVNRNQAWELGRDLSLYLHQSLATFMPPCGWPDLAWIVVAKGPGGYTGTRLGVVTARTLAQQLNLPLYGVSTLAMFAWAYIIGEHYQPDVPLAVDMPGQKGHVHGGIYQLMADQTLEVRSSDRHLTHSKWDTALAQQNIEHRLSLPTAALSDDSLSQALLTLGQQQQVKG